MVRRSGLSGLQREFAYSDFDPGDGRLLCQLGKGFLAYLAIFTAAFALFNAGQAADMRANVPVGACVCPHVGEMAGIAGNEAAVMAVDTSDVAAMGVHTTPAVMDVCDCAAHAGDSGEKPDISSKEAAPTTATATATVEVFENSCVVAAAGAESGDTANSSWSDVLAVTLSVLMVFPTVLIWMLFEFGFVSLACDFYDAANNFTWADIGRLVVVICSLGFCICANAPLPILSANCIFMFTQTIFNVVVSKPAAAFSHFFGHNAAADQAARVKSIKHSIKNGPTWSSLPAKLASRLRGARAALNTRTDLRRNGDDVGRTQTAATGKPARAARVHQVALFLVSVVCLVVVVSAGPGAPGALAGLVGVNSLSDLVMSIKWNCPEFENDPKKKGWHGSPWANDTEYTLLDKMLGHALQTPLKDQPVETGSGSATAMETVKGISSNFTTVVMATVFVAGWRLFWLSGVMMLIVGSHASCEYLYLHAVQGGEFANAPDRTPWRERTTRTECDCELALICALCEALGGEVGAAGSNDSKYRWWSWSFKRSDGSDFTVILNVHKNADDIEIPNVAFSLHPQKQNATSPNLRRLAVVSSPVNMWKDGEAAGRADEQLNEAINQALKLVKKNTEVYGWKSDMPNFGYPYPDA